MDHGIPLCPRHGARLIDVAHWRRQIGAGVNHRHATVPTPDCPPTWYTIRSLAKAAAAADTTSPYASTNSLLTARDYLNASTSDPAPFDFCPVFGPGDEVAERRGQWGLLKARLHTGSGARVQRVLQKAMAGMPVTISVLGGSGGSTRFSTTDRTSATC